MISCVPLIRCPECAQAYDIPPALAVRLPDSLAHCSCGHWLFGDREALLHRIGASGEIDELDVQPFRCETSSVSDLHEEEGVGRARSIRIIARTRDESVDRVFTIGEHPLWIGRRGCHLEFDDAELSIQHCCVSVRGGKLFLRDADSHTGTFLDGHPVGETLLDDGIHLLRVGHELISIEPVEQQGSEVEPLSFEPDELLQAPAALLRKGNASLPLASPGPLVLRCIEGSAAGASYDIPAGGATVGRDGSIKVPDDYLSRKHFSLRLDDDGNLRVQDLGSRNGTFLNSLPARNSRIHVGDEIRAGLSAFRIEKK